MRRSRTTFASEAGWYVHLGIVGVLSLLAVRHAVAIVFLVPELWHLWHRARRIFFGALFVSALLVVRMAMVALRPEPDMDDFEGVVVETADGRFVVRTGSDTLLVFHDGATAVEPGDEVEVRAHPIELEPRSVEHGFDYGIYLLGRGIDGVCRADVTAVTGRRFVFGRIAFLLSAAADRRFDGDARTMIGLFVLGDADLLPADLTESGRSLGITHLFAVSGMHVGAIALFLERLLVRMHVRRSLQAIAIGTALVLFAAATGFSVSIVRAAATYLVLAVAKRTKCPLPPADAAAFVALGALFVHPYALYDVGFQLSYLVAFAIVLGGELVKASDPVRRTLRVTLLAQAVALPVTLELNGAFNLAAIPANLLFVLFVDRAAVPLAFLVWFVPAAEPLLDAVGRGFFVVLEAAGTVDLSLSINLASDVAKAAYWIGLGLTLSRLTAGKSIGRAAVAAFAAAVIAVAIPKPPAVTVVRVFDVGQGDALYVAADDCRMLVDTGASDAYDTLLGYFQKENVRTLDYLVLTHGDDDHDGETADLDAGLTIGAIVASTVLCPACRAPSMIVATGDDLACGAIRLRVLSAGTEGNDGSIVLYGTIGSDAWILMGDAGERVENAVAWPDADVLKVGHHGAATSTTAALVAATTPSIAVISVGRTNAYGHPDEAVLERLAAAGTAVLRTDRLGTISFHYLPGGVRVTTSRSEDERLGQAAGRIVRIALVFLSARRRDIMDTVIG